VTSQVLIVLAHPARNSLSHLFAQEALKAAESGGKSVKLLDLYQEQFQPSLTQSERASYYAAKPDISGVSDYARHLSEAETLVLVFPTWWFGLPAILKGWLDRAFAPGVAFDHADDFGPIRPCLQGLKYVLVVTTLGSPWWVDWLAMRRPVRRILKTAVFGLCAPGAKFQMLSLYQAEKPKAKTIEKTLRRIRAVFS
jgi:NAD(P)H dehydrogenase (quinone)